MKITKYPALLFRPDQEHHFRFHYYEPSWQSKPVFRNNLTNSYESARIKTNLVPFPLGLRDNLGRYALIFDEDP